jgi:mRNA-degrading endonuclease RelE of RelBE toxin-antitoxin system
VAGLTVEELRAQRERFLDEGELLDMRSHDLVHLDPVKVAVPLRPLLIERLVLYGELEAAVQLFEKTGVPEDLTDDWLDCVDEAVKTQRRDLLDRLILSRGESPAADSDPLPIGARLLLADESHVLAVIEEAAQAALRNPDNESIDLAYALLESRWPALGILVSRGWVASGSVFDSEVLFDALLETRDRLNLPPDDPLQQVLDWRFQESLEAHRDSAALMEARQRLDAKSEELSQARVRLARVQADLLKKERESAPRPAVVAAPAAPAPAADEAAVRDLRRRVDSLKGELKQRHDERNRLRLELRSAHETLETLRRRENAPGAPEEAESGEESLLEEQDAVGVHPLRIPEFSHKFLDSLQALPLTAARHVLSAIGRLAAGESGAFAGVKRLKANREILRLRVGADYRLLFRLQPAAIELLAAIPRRDLDRKIRSLTS